MRSSYSVQTFNLCAITDLDEEGRRSVTNDIEAVLADLVEAGVLVPGHPFQRVIYRDSERRWDQVVMDAQCGFMRFAPIGGDSPGRKPPDADPREMFALLLLDEMARESGRAIRRQRGDA